MKFKVSDKIFKDFPDVVEYVVVGSGLNNEISAKKINDKLDETTASLKGKKDILEDDKYSKWIDTYNKFTGSSKFLPSHVALANRAVEGKRIPHISPIVSFYNYYSLKYGVCIGGEDLDQIYGDLELKYSEGDELYLGLGGKKVEKIPEGEVIWVDDHSVTCRRWGWRQSERTKITKNTKNMYFIFDTFGEENFEKVVNEFSEELVKTFGGSVEILKLSKQSSVATSKHKSMVLKATNDTNKDLEQLIDTGLSEVKKSRGSIFQRRAKSLGLVDDDHLTQRLSKMVDDVLSEGGVREKSEIQMSQNSKFGDCSSTVVLREAKKSGKPVKELGQNVVKILESAESLSEMFSEIHFENNGFLNFFMSEKFMTDELSNSVNQNEGFGMSGTGKDRTILIESPSINPNAPAHVGHLRNLLIGRSLARLFEHVGFKVEKDNLINDKDNKVCMAMWAYEKYGESKTPEQVSMKSDHFVGKYYVKGRKAYKEDPGARKEIIEMLKDLEEGESDITKLWEKITDWAFTGHKETFERLHEERGYLWFESDLWEGGKKLVEDYLDKGVVERLPDGAIVGRIEEKYGVPDVVLLRSDGTSLYHTQDLNLTIKKIEKFNPWKAVWVLGNEHMLHFQRLFALIDALGILDIENLYAYLYGMVLGKDGKKISSRAGGDINADQILDMARDAALQVIDSRDIDEKNKQEIAERVGQGAIRYEVLSKDAFKDIKLDIEKAVSFTGKSGSYVMYAYTRAKSILKKVKKSSEDMSETNMSEIEKTLLLRLLSYPEIVLSAANNYAPSVIADYSYGVANLFNNFYENVPVKDSKGGELNFRIALTELTANVLNSSLGILGIEVIKKM